MPDGSAQYLYHFYLELNGSPAPAAMQNDLLEVHIDSSLHLPDAATVILSDNATKWVDEANVMPGKTLKIKAKSGTAEDVIFDGEIVELEPSFAGAEIKLTIRAFDRLHRLTRGRAAKTFVQMTDSDIMQKVIQEAGLTAQVDSTSEVYDHVFQDNLTNLEFLQQRASLNGFYLYAEGTTIHCAAADRSASPIELNLHNELSEFHPRLSTSSQVSGVTVRGWNVKDKQEVVGSATKGDSAPSTGVSQSGGDLAQSAHNSAAKLLVNDPVVRTQRAADQLAKAVANRLEGRFIEAEGSAMGNPHLLAGSKIKIKGVGTRFSGEYFVTSSSHSYSASSGYTTAFMVSGHDPQNLVSLLSADKSFRAAPTLSVGLVTDNNDPENLGRVKLKYPALSSDDGSFWARVVSVGGGKERGIMYLPEVNDEVLVGFEGGSIDQPYVLGGLWNGQDAPPLSSSDAVGSNKVKQRIIKSLTGHIILLDDSDDKPGITIQDQTGKNLVKIDSKSNAMTIQMDGDTTITAKGAIKIDSQKGIEITATQDINIKGSTGVKMDGGPSVDVKASNISVSADAALDLKANATATLQGSAMTEIKGGLVKIN